MNARSSILAFALMSVAAAAPAAGTDADFATKAGQANLAEVAAGRLAVSQGGRDDVKTFGQRHGGGLDRRLRRFAVIVSDVQKRPRRPSRRILPAAGGNSGRNNGDRADLVASARPDSRR